MFPQDELYAVDVDDPQPVPTPEQMARWQREGWWVAVGALALIVLVAAGIAFATFETVAR